MHGIDDLPTTPAESPASGPWYRELNAYHWFVLVVASLGWLFDCMDQRVFLISRQAAMTDLLGYQKDDKGNLASQHGKPLTDEQRTEASGEIKWYSGLATTVFMLGWAGGGLYFGIMGDRWGRAKTMIVTIVLYSAFTGLSALSQHWWDFMIYRFITGMGVGGEFAAGISLVAEAMPTRARPFALGMLQALSAVGNIIGSLLSLVIMPFGWQYMFVIGTAPALLALLIMRKLKEPESWVKARAAQLAEQAEVAAAAAAGKPLPPKPQMGNLAELFRDPRWRYNTIIGMTLAVSGVIGLWGVGFWSFELIAEALKGLPSSEANTARGVGTALQDVGAFFGIFAFTAFTARVGRRLAFATGYFAAACATFLVFGFMKTQTDVYWMLPILGFCNLSVFGGFAIYFPELYPTRLRSTGSGFCYNAARFIAAFGPYMLGSLAVAYGTANLTFLSSMGGVDSALRYAALTVASIYVLGIVVMPFAPETKGKPLPE